MVAMSRQRWLERDPDAGELDVQGCARVTGARLALALIVSNLVGAGLVYTFGVWILPEVPIDVVAHVRRLEEVMIRVCRDFGVETVRVEGRSGVWVLADERGPDRKLGAIGVRVSRRVTMHGFALNCDADLGWADAIIPCGIADAGVSSLTQEAGRVITVQDVLPYAEKHLADVLRRS